MQTIIQALRQILGTPDFYVRLENQQNYTWDYGAMIEYMVGAMILMIVISYVFRILKWLFARQRKRSGYRANVMR